MPVRIPLDVDLEDRLIYGLSPQRFGYAALGLLAAMATGHSLPGPAGIAAAVVIASIGAAFAWGRWAGRGFDAWAVGAVRFAFRTYRLELDPTPIQRLAGRWAALRGRRPKIATPPRHPPSEWRPRRDRTAPPPPPLRVIPTWDPDP